MMSEIENAFDCTFAFNTLNKTISITYLDNSIEDGNIFYLMITLLKTLT